MRCGFFWRRWWDSNPRAHLWTKRFRVGVAIQTLAENKRSSTTMQELKNPCKIKAFSLLKGEILKKPCVTRSSNIFRFWGEKSAFGRRWGELGEKITVLNADDTYLRAE